MTNRSGPIRASSVAVPVIGVSVDVVDFEGIPVVDMLQTGCVLRTRAMMVASIVATSSNHVASEIGDVDVDCTLVVEQDVCMLRNICMLRTRGIMVASIVSTSSQKVASEIGDADVDYTFVVK